MQTIQLPYFDHAEAEVDTLADVGDIATDDGVGAATLQAFLGLTAADRIADTRHVYAYYRDFHEAIGGEEALDPEMGVPETPEAIWRHVRPRTVYLMSGRGDEASCYLIAVCDCDWEIEHGLAMVWRDGTTLCKVGGDDGHVTNAAAFADDSLWDVVYPGIDRTFRTWLTP